VGATNLSSQPSKSSYQQDIDELEALERELGIGVDGPEVAISDELGRSIEATAQSGSSAAEVGTGPGEEGPLAGGTGAIGLELSAKMTAMPGGDRTDINKSTDLGLRNDNKDGDGDGDGDGDVTIEAAVNGGGSDADDELAEIEAFLDDIED